MPLEKVIFHSFETPYYVCKMQRTQADDESIWYSHGVADDPVVDKALKIAQSVGASVAVRRALLDINKSLRGVSRWGATTVKADTYGQEVIDDLRALHDWVDAIGSGTVDDPDNVMCLPNPANIGKKGFCPYCGQRGGRGSCCD